MISSYLIRTNLKRSLRIFAGIFSVLILLMPLTGCVEVIAETSSHVFTTHKACYIDIVDLGDASQYWNTAWRGRSTEAIEVVDTVKEKTSGVIDTVKEAASEASRKEQAVVKAIKS